VGEISEPRIRGMLTGTNFLSHSIGILVVYILGAVMEWNVLSGVSTVFPLLSSVAFVLLPESPVWLVRNNKIREAEKALTWLRGGVRTQVRARCLMGNWSTEGSDPGPYDYPVLP